MVLHTPTCPRWLDPANACGCVPEWRIRKAEHPTDTEYPWLVHRWIESNGRYELFVRATTWDKAMGLVTALITFDRSFADDIG